MHAYAGINIECAEVHALASHEQVVAQTVQLPVVWHILTSIWRNNYVTPLGHNKEHKQRKA